VQSCFNTSPTGVACKPLVLVIHMSLRILTCMLKLFFLFKGQLLMKRDISVHPPTYWMDMEMMCWQTW
jgi:hypothetical protein